MKVENEGMIPLLGESNFPNKESYVNTIFQHFAERAMGRYNRKVEKHDWSIINSKIDAKKALFIGYASGRAELWLCQGMVVLYTDMARTVLPYEDFSGSIKRALKEKNNNLAELKRGELYSQSKYFLDAKSSALLYYNLHLTEEMWEDIKTLSKNALLVKQWKADKVLRLTYASRELFLTTSRDNVESLKIARPGKVIKKTLNVSDMLSKAIRKKILAGN